MGNRRWKTRRTTSTERAESHGKGASMNDKNHTVSESADKIRLKTKIKRGTDTRDQDEIEVVVKGDDPQEAVDKLHETVVAIGSKGTHKALRGTQPGEDDE